MAIAGLLATRREVTISPDYDQGTSIAVDSFGNAYVAGRTFTASLPAPWNFPTTPGAFRRTGEGEYGDVFVAKVDASGAALTYSTILGGRRADHATDLALDAQGSAYVAGSTGSDNFPTSPGAYQTQLGRALHSDPPDGFVTKPAPVGGELAYSTFFGTPGTDGVEVVSAIAVNSAGEVYIAGGTDSALFPTTNDARQRTFGGSTDAFLAKLNATGSAVLYSTYLGGDGQDRSLGLALDASENVYVVGSCQSENFPVTPGSFQTFPGGNQFDGGAFITKFGGTAPAGHSIGGRVTDGASGISRAMVRLSGSLEGTQWTGPDGSYSFGNLPPGGTYTVTPSRTLYDFGTQRRAFNHLSADETADFTATLQHFRIAGQARDTNGAVLSGVSVNLFIGGVNTASAQTDADGRYAFSDLPAAGTYDVSPFKANYTFTPSFRRFENLTADVAAADFTGRLSYRVLGRLTDASGAPIAQVRVDLEWSTNGTPFRVSTQTNSLGNYGFINLTPGGTYTVTPSSFAYSFVPASQTFSNIAATHTADFTGTFLLATISGRVADETGKGVPGVTVRVSGGATSQGFTDSSGNYTVSGLRKGLSYTLSPVLLGYSFTPASKVVELSGNTTADFAARLLTPRPFTPGNILVSANHVLTEYTPEGAQVQAVIVPQPLPTPIGSQPHQTGDVVLDKNGDALIVNSRPLALASFSQPRQSWQNVTLNASTNFHELGGLAAVGDYAFAPSVDDSNQGPRRGLVRLNMIDNSVAHFQTVTGPGSYQDLTAGLDGLLYALSYTESSDFARLHVLDPQTLQLVRERLMGFNTLAVAANSAGDVFFGTRQGVLARSKADGTVVKQVSLGGQQFQIWDIDVSADGRIVVSAPEKVIVLDEELNVLSSFTPRNGQGYTGFTKPAAVASVQLAASAFGAGEGAGQATVAVTRTGDLSGPASVEFSTTDDPAAVRCDVANGAAYARCDYATTVDTVRFDPGETQKTIAVPLINDVHAEGAETVQLKLRQPSGAVLGPQSTAVLTIADDDTSAAPNPVSHNSFFVRMQYLDFLSRGPEIGEPWTGVLDRCPNVLNDPACDRILVSGAFFQSPEFQLKGYYTFLFYKAALGRLPEYSEIIPDMRSVAGQTGDEVYEKRVAFAESFAQRLEFKGLYGDMTNQQYVDALLGRYGVQQITTEDPAAPEGTVQVTLTKLQLTNALTNNSLTRAQVLRAVVQSSEADAAEYHGAFVAMQYYGYLRRTPEQGGYDSWLRVIRQDPNNIRAMVNGFVNSQEYRLRFGQP